MAVMQHSGVRVSHVRWSWLKVAVDVPGKLFHSHVIFNFVRSQGKERSAGAHAACLPWTE